jgi:SAM-dependent methyltransferase
MTHETPLIDEVLLAGPEHLDAAYVAAYDRKAGVEPADDIERLRDHGLDARSTLVDLGAGTGTFALAVGAKCARVVAVDVSPVMVAATRRKVEDAGVGNVECVHAGFLSYDHVGERADFVYTRNALHHLPDFWKAIALSRIADLLAPGGILYLRDLVFAFDLHEAGDKISEWLASGRPTPDEGWTREELEVHLRDEFSTFSWLLEPMLRQTGFEIVDEWHGGPGSMYAGYVCTKGTGV